MTKVTIATAAYIKYCCRIIIGLFIAHSLTMVSIHGFQRGRLYGLINLFNFDHEYNFPALYSALNLLFASVLLAIIAISHHRQQQPYRCWAGLAAIFAFLSIDEITVIHERFIAPVGAYFSNSAITPIAWVIPYGIATIIFLTSYTKFLFHLPRSTRRQIILAAIIFLMGAIGCELLGSIYITAYGRDNWLYGLIYTTEELSEMFGIVVFVHALLTYIPRHFSTTPLINIIPAITRPATAKTHTLAKPH